MHPATARRRTTFRWSARVLAVAAALAWTGTAVAAFPGANGRIAYSSNGDIFTVRPDGSGVTRLTNRGPRGAAINSSPVWSPCGRRIAFLRYGPRGLAIFVMNANGSHLRRVTPFSQWFLQAPVWRPTGSRIAYVDDSGDQLGARVAAVWTTGASGAGRADLTGYGDLSISPSWSPDGTRIAYTRLPGGDRLDAPEGEVWVMGADGSGKTQLTSNDVLEDLVAWSPDGARIAFTRAVPGEEGDLGEEIWTMRPDGTDQRRLTGGTATYGRPLWSPRGGRILFTRTSLDGSRVRVYVMNRDGARLRLVAAGAAEAAWSPDGTRILLGDGSRLWTARPNGTRRRVIVEGAAWQADWQAAPVRRLHRRS